MPGRLTCPGSSLRALRNPIPVKRKPGGTIHILADQIVRTGLRSLDVKSFTKRPPKTQPVSDLPLFAWRIVVLRPATQAGQFVARRYRIHPAFADLVANLAGLGSEVR